MNSDFMQVEAEDLAKRVAGEPDNRAAHTQGLPICTYGREPSEQEIKLGIDYLHAEPMKEYEENKNKPPADAGAADVVAAWRSSTMVSRRPPSPKPARRTGRLPAAERGGRRAHGDGHDGWPCSEAWDGRRGAGAAAPPPVKYEPTAWGRYAKVLLSSSEFLFIN